MKKIEVTWSKSRVFIVNWLIMFIAFYLVLTIIVSVFSYLVFGPSSYNSNFPYYGYGFPLLRIFMSIYFVHKFKITIFKQR